MDRKFVTYVVEENIAIITLDNPPVNALSLDVVAELEQILEELKVADAVRVVILTGKGKAFVAGANMKVFLEFNRKQGEHYALTVTDMQRKLEEFDLPVIAAINGFALGGGCELAMACDIRIASEKAIFGQPELKIGVIPGAGGTQRLPRLISVGKAKKLIYTGDHISAAEAERIGLVDQVVPAGEELSEAVKLARRIIKTSPVALRLAKKSVNRGLQMSLNDALQLEAVLFGEVFETDDVKEGVNAFLEKREPVFKGK
jgi:enoyl-CoA hydratase